MKVGKQFHGVLADLWPHPGHHEKDRHRDSREARELRKRGFLQRSQHLNNVHYQTDRYCDRQNWRCQQQNFEQRVAANIYNLRIRHQLKLLTNDPINRPQPSTITNSSSLSGVEITTGGNCSMPTEVVIEATTMSITMKGRKRMAPIWNPALSSERI